MITATEASRNVINHAAQRYAKVKEKAMTLLEEMSASIEFHSKSGIDTIDFTPYKNSLFLTEYDLTIASDIFETVFKENGYTIIRNDISQNSLKIKW